MADGAAEFSGVIEVDCIHRTNRASTNVFGRDANLQSGQRKNGKLGAGVAAVEVFAGVSFGIAASLCLFESFAERNASSFDTAENVIASAVQDAGNAMQSISAKPGA